jgi:hypothetical protein
MSDLSASTSGADAAATVDRYLQLCEDRDLRAAARLLVHDPLIVFPGSRVFASLAQLVEAAATQYRWVRKHRDHVATALLADGAVEVTSRGRLYGENLHGVEFDDVRYVDVFVLRGGLIAEQHVWNDLAATGALARTTS